MDQAETKLSEAIQILTRLGFRGRHANKLAGYVLLALLDLKPSSAWIDAQRPLRGVSPVIDFINRNYAPAHYAPNTRESVRDEAIRPFVNAGILLRNPDNPNRAASSGKTAYQIEPGALRERCSSIQPELLPAFGGNHALVPGRIPDQLHIGFLDLVESEDF